LSDIVGENELFKDKKNISTNQAAIQFTHLS